MSNSALEFEPRARERSSEASLINNSNNAEHTGYSSTSYSNHTQSPPDGRGGGQAGQASPIQGAHPLPHGYSHAPPTQNAHIDPQLRSAHETAASASLVYAPVPTMMPAGMSPQSDQSGPMSGPGGSVGVPSISMGGVDAGDNSTDGRKAKRELSQSKRAAQNRAAQRAFRQRKEGYIKKLEQQVRDYAAMENNFKEMQQENYAMKEYIIHLQSQLLESHGEFPQPPPNVNLQHHQAHAHAHHHAPPPPPSGINAPDPVGQPQSAPPPANSLEVAAQAVAGLSRSEHIVAARDHHYAGKVYEQQAVAARADDDDRTAEEITRQLQADGAPDSLPAVPM